jgi:alpha-glucosidase
VWTASNHDVSRFPTRWCRGDERKARLALLVLATLPGTVVLYYGDEIAMTDVPVPPDLRRDGMAPGGRRGKGRDRARTPMPWDSSPAQGFTADNVAGWLPYGEHAERNVAAQRGDPASTLHLCRDLIALRRAEFGGRLASYTQLPGPPGLWAYRTSGRSGDLTVAANFSDEPLAWPEPVGEVLLATDAAAAAPGRAEGRAWLGPWAGVVARSWPRDL